jgi:hypothetical protein
MQDDRAIGEILQRLYSSEINLRIEWVWDGGVQWRLGDEFNGWTARGTSDSVAQAARDVGAAAAQARPESEFAAWWRTS